jgi:hypothetical protein
MRKAQSTVQHFEIIPRFVNETEPALRLVADTLSAIDQLIPDIKFVDSTGSDSS